MKKPTVTVAFQIMPHTSNHKKNIALVDTAIAIIKKSGVVYEVGPMETTMEGNNLEKLLAIVKEANDICLARGAKSTFINLKVACNPSGLMSIHEKVTKHR